MINKTLITIVVPVYKVPGDLLRKCLNSIVSQTVENFEVIIIDDGSPDDCGNICEEYASKHKNMCVIHQTNAGLSVVRNNGIEAASSEWICFVDGDDWIEKNTMELAEKYIEECKDGDVLLWDEFIDIGEDIKRNRFFDVDKENTLCFEKDECKKLIEYMLPENGISGRNTFADIGTANARLYNRKFLLNYNLRNKPGLKRMQDNIFNLWVYNAANKIYYRPYNLYHYVSNDNAATRRFTPDIADTMYFLFSCYIEFIENTDNTRLLQPLYCKFIRLLVRCFELNYAHPDNKKSLRVRIRDAKKDMNKPYFIEIVENVEIKSQPLKIKLMTFLLRYKLYYCIIFLSKLIVITRKKRLQFRR